MSSGSGIEAGRAYVKVELRQSLDAGIAQVQNRLKALSRELSEYGTSIAKIGSAIATGFGSALAALIIPTKIAADIETVTEEFKALTGSASLAIQTIGELRTFAKQTPFTFQGLADETRTLLIYGISARQATTDIRTIAGVAGGSQERLQRLALAFGQVASRGKLMATEIRQFSEAGFNPLQEMVATTGKSFAKLTDEVTKGLVSFEDVRQAFVDATSAGGRFYGLLAKKSQTVAGLFVQLRDNIKIAIEPIGKALLPALKLFLRELNTIVQDAGKWISANRQLVYSFATIAAAGTVVGAAITGVGVTMLVAGKAIETFNALFVQGPRLFLGWARTLMSTGQAATVASTAINAATQEAFAEAIVTSTTVQRSLGSLGRSFNRLGSKTVGAMQRMTHALTAGNEAILAQISAMTASTATLGPALAAEVDAATAVVSAALVPLSAAFTGLSANLEIATTAIVASVVTMVNGVNSALVGLSAAVAVQLSGVSAPISSIAAEFATLSQSITASLSEIDLAVSTHVVGITGSLGAMSTAVTAEGAEVVASARVLRAGFCAEMQAMAMCAQKSTTRILAHLKTQQAALKSYASVLNKLPKLELPSIPSAGGRAVSGATKQSAVKAQQEVAKTFTGVFDLSAVPVVPPSLDGLVANAQAELDKVDDALRADMFGGAFRRAPKPEIPNMDNLVKSAEANLALAKKAVSAGTADVKQTLLAGLTITTSEMMRAARANAARVEQSLPNLNDALLAASPDADAWIKAMASLAPKRDPLEELFVRENWGANVDLMQSFGRDITESVEAPDMSKILRGFEQDLSDYRFGTPVINFADILEPPSRSEFATLVAPVRDTLEDVLSRDLAGARVDLSGISESVAEAVSLTQQRLERVRLGPSLADIDLGQVAFSPDVEGFTEAIASVAPKRDTLEDLLVKDLTNVRVDLSNIVDNVIQPDWEEVLPLDKVLREATDLAGAVDMQPLVAQVIGDTAGDMAEFAAGMASFDKSLGPSKAMTGLVDGLEAVGGKAKKVAVATATAGRTIGGGLAGAFRTLLTPLKTFGGFLAAILIPVGVVVLKLAALVAIVVAVGYGFAQLLKKAGYLTPMINGVKSALASMLQLWQKFSKGLSDAIQTGDWAGAIKLAWLTAKVAFYRGLNALADAGGWVGVAMKVYRFMWDMAVTVMDILWNLFLSLPKLLTAALLGIGDVTKIIEAAVAGGSSGAVKKSLKDAETELDAFSKNLSLNADRKRKDSEKKALNVFQKDEAERTNKQRVEASIEAYEEIGRQGKLIEAGVIEAASKLPQAEIEKANEASAERTKELRKEIAELIHGKDAVAAFTSALEGTTAISRAAEAAALRDKKIAESNKTAREKVKSLQEEIATMRTSALAVEQFKLAQEGVTATVRRAILLKQQEKMVLEQLNSSQEQITTALLGAEAAEALKLAQQGLTKAQIAQILSSKRLATELAELRTFADKLNEQFKTPLQTFRETEKQIREAQLRGMISGQVAAQAYSEALQDMKAKAEELKDKTEPLQLGTTQEKRQEIYERLRKMTEEQQADKRGRVFAARNRLNAVGAAAKPNATAVEKMHLDYLERQTWFLRDIKKAVQAPTIEVRIF